MEQTMIDKLIETAIEQLKFSYTPYSNFKVGAALLAKDGKIYTGCNIENAAYTPTNCAERTAIFKAVSEGYREFQVIAIISDSKELTSPCGVWRQVMAEFCEPDFEVIMLSCEGKYKVVTLVELLPYAFSLTEEQLATAPELS